MSDAVSASSALDTAGNPGPTPRLVMPQAPLSTRIKNAAIVFALKNLLLTPIFYFTELRKYFTPPSEHEPDAGKTYPIRKCLTVRIFYPPSHRDTSQASSPPAPNNNNTTKLPTLLTIHGGGFTLGHPHDNDRWNRTFSTRHTFLVIALDYSKAPSSPFPTAIHDLEALILCILADTTLPLDTSRVALAGWSAGGNLVLSVSQLPSLQGKIHAAVPMYPPLDMVTPPQLKARGRRYKPDLGGFRGKESDFQLTFADVFDWAYLEPFQRCDDPLVSPVYAERENLPRNIFIVACELDMLAHGSWRLACRLGGKKVPGLEEAVGRQETAGEGVLITEGDERFAWEVAMEDGARYRWLLVPDTVHGFDHEDVQGMANDPVFLEDAYVKTDKLIGLIGEWLLEGPLKADS